MKRIVAEEIFACWVEGYFGGKICACWVERFVVGLALVGKDIVFRFIIEYGTFMEFDP
jgi:hypothetical protein